MRLPVDAISLGKWLRCLIGAAVAVLLGAGHALAQEPAPRVMAVGVYVSEPFVVPDGDGYSGMAIELWERATSRLNVVSQYKAFDSYAALVEAVASGAVEAAVTNLSITGKRAEAVDFTYPWFDGGLRVMVDANAGTSLSETIKDLSDAGHLANYAWLALLLLVATTLLTLFDRRFDNGFPRRWRDGLAESFYHVMSIATTGRSARKNLLGWIGRVWQGAWMVCGVAVIAYVTSTVASVMTANQLTNEITSVGDLGDKTVGVHRGSLSEDYMQSIFVATRPFDHMEEAVDALRQNDIAAIVGDTAVLEYYAHTHPALDLDVVGNVFRPNKYGFAFPPGSALTRPVSQAIVQMYDSGEIEKLRTLHFGRHP